MQSGQKGTLENKHIELRYILPKGTDLKELGLTCQYRLNLVLSHVNSSPCELLGNKSPLELTEFMYQACTKNFWLSVSIRLKKIRLF